MTLAIVGAGLATPFGLTPREHVLFQRAFVPGPAASPFLMPDDRRVHAFHCDWLDPDLPPEERMAALAEEALDEALRPLAEVDVPLTLALNVPAPRPGLDGPAIARLGAAIRRMRPFASVRVHSGDAGAIAALATLLGAGDRDDAAPTVVLGVDSFIGAEWLTHIEIDKAPTRWEAPRLAPSEGAAALVVVPPRRASRLGLRRLGAVTAAASAVGAARDDNDDLVDGTVMTELIDRVAPARVSHVYGQERLDPLRSEDWNRGSARHGDRFWECEHTTVEARTGTLGAASAAASMVVGLFTSRLHAGAGTAERPEAFLAWALSADGTRGVASLQVEDA